MRTRSIVPLLTASLALAACGKKSDSNASSAAKPGEAAAPAAAAKPVELVWKKIPSIGIEVQVPPDADVQDNTANAGFMASTIFFMDGSAPTTFIFGAKDLADAVVMSADLESTKARVQKEMNGWKSFTKEEKTADGFVLTYTGADVLEATTPLYGATVRTVVAGVTLDCSSNAPTTAEIDKVIAFCKNLRAAK